MKKNRKPLNPAKSPSKSTPKRRKLNLTRQNKWDQVVEALDTYCRWLFICKMVKITKFPIKQQNATDRAFDRKLYNNIFKHLAPRQKQKINRAIRWRMRCLYGDIP